MQIEQQIISIIIDYEKDQGDCKQLAEMKKDKPQSVASLRANMQKLSEERVFTAKSGVWKVGGSLGKGKQREFWEEISNGYTCPD